MGETVGKSPPAASEEQVRSLVRQVLEDELVEWRILLKRMIEEQEGISRRMDKIERTLPAAVSVARSMGTEVDGIETEKRRLDVFLQKMEASYREGRISDIELMRARQRITERLELLRRAEEESRTR